jgi:hypothetical protein
MSERLTAARFDPIGRCFGVLPAKFVGSPTNEAGK